MQTITREILASKLAAYQLQTLPPTETASLALQSRADVLFFGERKVTQRAYERLSSLAGIPSTYAAKTPIELMLPHLRYWLPAAKYGTLKPVVDQEEIVGFVRPGAPVIPPLDILEEIEDNIGPVTDLQYGFAAGDHELMTFSVFGPKQDEVEKGDVLQGGVTVSFSMIDAAPFEVLGSTLRLICMNGATSSELHYRASRKTPQSDLMEWIGKAAATAWGEIRKEFDAVKRSREHRLEDHVGMTIDSIFTEFRVPLSARDDIRDLLIEGETHTIYDVANAITQVGSNDPDILNDARAMLRMMGIGGRLARHGDVCPTCYRVR